MWESLQQQAAARRDSLSMLLEDELLLGRRRWRSSRLVRMAGGHRLSFANRHASSAAGSSI